MFPKEDSEEEELSYWSKKQLQQVVPERRFGKKCKRCWRKGQGLSVSKLLKHEDFCSAPDSEDSSSENEQTDLPEPDAADDDPNNERKKLYSVEDQYRNATY